MAEEDILDSALPSRRDSGEEPADGQSAVVHDDRARTLLRAKLQPPALPANSVDRPRLAALLKAVLDLPLTLVSAPVGFGKSTLVAQMLAQVAAPVAWLALDEYDNDLLLFLDYLIAAIQCQFPDACCQTLRLLHDFETPSAERLATSLLNEVLAIATPLVLALDDFHHLTDPRIHLFFATWLRSLPANLHLVVTTQTDPPWPLARLVARGQMQEVRAADLRFRLDEGVTFLTTAPGLLLSPDDMKLLVTQTEGWIAVLRLATLGFRGQRDVRHSLNRLVAQDHLFAGRFLVNEVLARQSPEVRDFLLRSAILDRLSAPLCAALMGPLTDNAPDGPGTQAISAWLRNPNLFIVPFGEEDHWYRYHILFRELLRTELATQWDSESIAELHRRASQWYADNGFTEDAVRHALAAGDSCLAADIIQDNVHEQLNREGWRGLERWLALLPSGLIRQRPSLLLAQAWLAGHHFEQRALWALIAEVEAALAVSDSPLTDAERATARAELAVTKSWALWWIAGDMKASLEFVQQAWATLPRDHTYARSVALFQLGLAWYASGRHSEATQFLRRVADALDESVVVRMRALLALAAIYRMVGPGRELERTIHRMDAAEAHHLRITASWARYFLGSLHYERNELDQAVEQFRLVTEDPYPGNFVCVRDSLIELALAYEAQGKPCEADATVRSLIQRCQPGGRVEEASSVSLQVRLALARGDVDEALRVAAQLPEHLPIWKIILTEIPAITRAQALVAGDEENERRQALKLLDALEAVTLDAHALRPLIRILALQAVGLTAAGRHGEGLVKLERAVRLAEPMGLARTFVDLGSALAPLLRTLRECGVAPAYLKHVLAAFPAETPVAPPAPRGNGEELIEALTNREMEILLLLEQRLSNKEIADKLFISTLTVKRHISRLIGKLDARNRREAVQRAQALGLLPPP